MDKWKPLEEDLQHFPGIKGVAPFIDGQGMLMRSGRLQGVMVRGIVPDKMDTVFPLSSTLIAGELSAIEHTPFGVIIGLPLAEQLGLSIGSKVTLLIPEATVSLAGVNPRVRQLEVVGLFESGYIYDSSHVFVNIQDMARLYHTGDAVSGLQARLDDPFEAPQVARALYEDFGPYIFAEPWTVKHAPYFQAVQMEKTIMFFILMLIVAVAAFNLVSTLVMLVTDKQMDIAILRAMGASKGMVMRIFIFQGALIGSLGTGLGIILGILLANNVTQISRWLESVLGQQLLATDVYFVDFLPSEFHVSDAVLVGMIAFLLSLLATLYPAWRAASIRPAEALRYG